MAKTATVGTRMDGDVEGATGVVSEGLATITGDAVASNGVFYNPAQVLNRDLSIVMLRVFADVLREEEEVKVKEKAKLNGGDERNNGLRGGKLRILEPLAATGLRSIRYALELGEALECVVAGDLDPRAVRCMEANAEANGVSKERLRAVWCDANQLMTVTRFGGIDACAALARPEISQSESDGVVTVELRRTEAPSEKRCNVIDLDPYGSVAGFLDGAVQAVSEGGMLCLTSTDMTVLCGNTPEVSFYKYGGTALKARFMHEMSLRLLINAVAVAAARHKRVIEPLVCCSVDFYIRCFVRVRTAACSCKLLASRTAFVAQCGACDAFWTQPFGSVAAKKTVTAEAESSEKGAGPENARVFKAPQLGKGTQGGTWPGSSCTECGCATLLMGGPFYSGSLYNKEFIRRCIRRVELAGIISGSASEGSNEGSFDTGASGLEHLTMLPKIRGILIAILEEHEDINLYYHLPSLLSRVKTETMKLNQFKSALLHLGYKVSHFHRDPQSLKTNAPNGVVFDIVREWAQVSFIEQRKGFVAMNRHPPRNKEKFPLLLKPIATPNIRFDLHEALSSAVQAAQGKVARWLPNPTPFWGPKKRANPRSEKGKEVRTIKRLTVVGHGGAVYDKVGVVAERATAKN